jgi:hypothetical protein
MPSAYLSSYCISTFSLAAQGGRDRGDRFLFGNNGRGGRQPIPVEGGSDRHRFRLARLLARRFHRPGLGARGRTFARHPQKDAGGHNKQEQWQDSNDLFMGHQQSLLIFRSGPANRIRQCLAPSTATFFSPSHRPLPGFLETTDRQYVPD